MTIGTHTLPRTLSIRRAYFFALKPRVNLYRKECTYYDNLEEVNNVQFHIFTESEYITETRIHFLWWVFEINRNGTLKELIIRKGTFQELSLIPPELDPAITPPRQPQTRRELFIQFYGREPEEGEI